MPLSRNLGVKSAARVLDLLERLAVAERPQTFAELSEGLGVPKSSLFHLLNTLAARGYVEQAREPKRAYRLGRSVIDLAQHVYSPDSVTQRMQPLVRELSTTLNAVAAYYEMRGDYVELMVARSATHALQIEIPLSRVAPLYPTAWGKMLLAHLSDAEIEAYIDRTEFKPFTPRTIVSGEMLWRDIRSARQEGFSIGWGEYASGWMALATTIIDAGEVVGSLGVVAPAERFDETFMRQARRMLAAISASFSEWPRIMTTESPPDTELLVAKPIVAPGT